MIKKTKENNELDADLVKLLKEDQETLENQLNNYRLKQIYRDSLEHMKKSSSLINAACKGC